MTISTIYAVAPNVYGVSVDRECFQVDLNRSREGCLRLDGQPAGELSDLVAEEVRDSMPFFQGKQLEMLCLVRAHLQYQNKSQESEQPDKAEAEEEYNGTLKYEGTFNYQGIEVTKQDLDALRTAFRDWTGVPSRSQLDQMNKYRLRIEYGRKHNKIVSINTGYSTTVACTPDKKFRSTGRKVAKDIINKILLRESKNSSAASK